MLMSLDLKLGYLVLNIVWHGAKRLSNDDFRMACYFLALWELDFAPYYFNHKLYLLYWLLFILVFLSGVILEYTVLSQFVCSD